MTIAIMAGGKSSRMGRDKSFIKLDGKPMIEHILDKVENLGDELLLISNNPAPYQYLGLPVYADVIPDLGPIGGLHTALKRSTKPHVLIVACDMPWLNRRLLWYMISIRDKAEAVVPLWTKHPEPLHAVYSQNCLPAIERRISEGKLKMVSFYDLISVHYVDRSQIAIFDPDGRSFANINTPADLKKASE